MPLQLTQASEGRQPANLTAGVKLKLGNLSNLTRLPQDVTESEMTKYVPVRGSTIASYNVKNGIGIRHPTTHRFLILLDSATLST